MNEELRWWEEFVYKQKVDTEQRWFKEARIARKVVQEQQNIEAAMTWIKKTVGTLSTIFPDLIV